MDTNDINEEKLLLNLSQKLLNSISNKDWDTYVTLCDENLTCVEPETSGAMCEGMNFHKTFFEMPNDENIVIKENILSPSIKFFGDIAIVCYKRIKQKINIKEKGVSLSSYAETRIWKKFESSTWKMVHFHKSS